MRALFVLTLLLAGANAFLWTEFLLYSQNTLLLDQRWTTTKRSLGMHLTGADSFLLTRAALQGDRLHLGAYYGGNEVLWRWPFEPRRIGFSFKVQEGAELSVLFDKTDAGSSGLRLSANRDHEGLFMRVTPEGAFERTEKFPSPVSPARWHRLELLFEEKTVTVRLDGMEAGRSEHAARETRSFGFRGGLKDAMVDDVVIEDAAGRTQTESFRNRLGERRVLALHAAAALLLLLGWPAAARLAGRRDAVKQALLRSVSWGLALLGVVAVLFAFDFFYWSRLELDPRSKPLGGTAAAAFAQTAETARYRTFAAWYRLIGGRETGRADLRKQGYPDHQITAGPIFCGRDPKSPPVPLSPEELEESLVRKKTAYRILFVGSSQTVGAGARSLQETFFVRTHRLLAASYGLGFPIESINASVSGTTAAQSFDLFRDTYLRFKPDLLVINFSVNGTPEELESGLSDLLKTAREKKIMVVLLKEAMARGAGKKKFGVRHRIVEDAAREHGAEVLDLEGFLSDPETDATGYLWWDKAHLTSYGQETVSRWLAPKLAASIRRARSGARRGR